MTMKMNLWSVIAGVLGCSLFSMGEGSAVSADFPAVRNVRMTQNQLTRQVTVTYEITGGPGIATLDIQTNGVSIGAENFRNAVGDVNREVEVGSHMLTWQPEKSWEGHQVTNAVAKISVWSKASPPNYMAIRLSPVSPNHMRWYTCEAALPRGIDDDLYRGEVLLMRRISQPMDGEWVMGSPAEESGRNPDREKQHLVTLTNDYWIGVFEVTQKQWSLIKEGVIPASFKGESWETRPVDSVSYDAIRGGNSQFHYPNAPAPNSFIGSLRAKTGIQSFDLPSEMQWEYACRAGTASGLNSGETITKPQEKDPEMDKLGRYKFNGGNEENTARVGSYLPNAWGLYDMHGNVWEWSLDWFISDISGLNGRVNTEMPASNPVRVRRGGGWGSDAAGCRSAYRSSYAPDSVYFNSGFRVVCSAEL